jgi:hypothetical protein
VDVKGGHVTWSPLCLEQLTADVQRGLGKPEASSQP